MKWFGNKPWGPICQDAPRVDIPVGRNCARCDEPIDAGDDGVLIPHLGGDAWEERPYHYECQMRSVIGGYNHIMGRCTCCGGTEPPDPPGLSRWEAAVLAVKAWEHKR